MRRFRRFFTRLLELLAVAVLIGVPAALVYLQFVGFGDAWREKFARALGGPTFAVEIGRLTFHPFTGIVAERVVVQRRGEARRLAEVGRIVVSPNLAELMHGRVSIDRLDVENTDAEIPFADDGRDPDAIRLGELRAEILSGNGQVTVSHVECRVEDIHVTVRGHFLMPPRMGNLAPKPSAPEHRQARADLIRAILDALHRVRFSGPRPELDVTLSGDLSAPETITADAVTLRTGGLRYEELSFDRLSLAASYANRLIRLANLRVSGRSGRVLLAGRWNLATNSGDADLSGGLTLAPLLRLAGQDELAKQISFDAPPAIEASADVALTDGQPRITVIGQTSAGAFRLRGVRGKGFAARFAWRDGRLFLQDAALRAQSGTIRADLLTGPGEFRLRLDSDADPTEFLDLFGPKERAIIGLLKFRDAPRLTMSLEGTRPSLDALEGKGMLTLGRSAMRDSWIDSGRAAVEVADRAIVYRDLEIKKGGLRAAGTFTYDFGRHEVRLDGIRSNMNPTDVLMWVDPRIADTVAPYRFRAPPDVRADGVVHMDGPEANDLRVAVDAPGGMAYTLLNRDLVFGATRATVHLKGPRVLADVKRAELMGGTAAIQANVSLAPDAPSFHVGVTLDGVDFPSMTQLYFGYSKSEGVMSGRYAFDASLREPEKMRGAGSIRVEKGQVLAIPVFGPLSLVISQIIPGAGHESARLATADFAIANQAISTKNLDISGEGFELFGDGNIGFPSGRMDLSVRINARGIPGIVLFPVSKLFEYVSTGTVSDPQWRPKIVPREFFDVLGLSGTPAKTPPASRKPSSAPRVR